MANEVRVKRRDASGEPGAPLLLWNAELAFNEAGDVLYIGVGNDGTGRATSVRAIAGAGAFATKAYVDAAGGGVSDGLRGEIRVSGTGANWAIEPMAVTNAKLAQAPALTIKGNATAGAASPSDLTAAQVKALLALTAADVGLGNANNTSDASKPISSAVAAALAEKAPLASPALSGVPTAPTAAPGNNTTQIATTAYVRTALDSFVATTDAMVYKGVVDCSTNPNYPAASNGWTYRVSVAGRIGGASGVSVEPGDFLICGGESVPAGDQATVGASWAVVQANIDGALTAGHIGVTVQAYSLALARIAGLSGAANRGLYMTAADTYALYTLSAAGRSLCGVTGAADSIPFFTSASAASTFASTLAGRNLLANAGTADTFPFYSAADTVSLASITAAGRSLLAANDGAAQRAALGLGTLAAQDSASVSITGGTIAGVIMPKVFATASYVPTTSDLQDGEIGANPVDGKTYLRHGGAVYLIGTADGGGGGGGGAPVQSGNAPLDAQNSAYTFVLADRGRVKAKTGTSAVAYTVAAGVHEAGDYLNVGNFAATGALTLTAGAGVTLYLAGSSITGNRTVGPRGFATVYMESPTVGYVYGVGIG